MQFVLDPVVFGPPADKDARRWIEEIRQLADLVSEDDLIATSAKAPRDQMLSRWWTDWSDQEGLAGFELARMAEEVSARVASNVPTPRSAPLLDDVSLEPSYVERRIDEAGTSDLAVHLAEAACARRDGADQLGIVGPTSSWSEPKDHVLVEGEVIARDDPDEEHAEKASSKSAVREFLQRSSKTSDVYAECYEFPCALMKSLRLGVRATYSVRFGGDPSELKFEIGPQFRSSITKMNYPHLAGNARKCLRVMTLIAAGRGGEVEGHEEREGEGPNDPILRVGGDPVMRAYISNHTPNAHRLFWIRRPTPLLLNVAGHSGRPAI